MVKPTRPSLHQTPYPVQYVSSSYKLLARPDSSLEGRAGEGILQTLDAQYMLTRCLLKDVFSLQRGGRKAHRV
jgi:hypothetical protein